MSGPFAEDCKTSPLKTEPMDDIDLGFADPRKNLAMSPDIRPPDNARKLKAWALGPELLEWSERFTPSLLEKGNTALTQIGNALSNIDSQMDMLYGATDDDSKADEMRLTILREKNINMLSSLVKMHATMTSGGVAAMFAALHKPVANTTNNVVNMIHHDTGATYTRRTLGSAEDQVVEI